MAIPYRTAKFNILQWRFGDQSPNLIPANISIYTVGTPLFGYVEVAVCVNNIIIAILLYLEESRFFGMCDSHDEESNEDQQMEEEGGNWVCLDEVSYPTSTDHNCGQHTLACAVYIESMHECSIMH